MAPRPCPACGSFTRHRLTCSRPKPGPNSVIAWRGPSLFTGRPVEVLVQALRWPSSNEKTGPVVQISIVQAGKNPSLLRGTRREADVCGDCPGQKRLEGWCYVDWQAWLIGQRRPLAVDVELARAAELLRRRDARVGAYGDPAAVPFFVWEQLLAGAGLVVGYTHAWRTCDPRFSRWFMASVHGHNEQIAASDRGWRTFRIREPGGRVMSGEVVCANEARGRTCSSCTLCDGTARGPAVKSVVITAHGPRASRFREAA